MIQPATQYARAGSVHVAYQVLGDGPVDVVWAWGLASNIEVVWEEPAYAAFLRRLSDFSRVILFDRRGCGVSDREGATVTPTLEERMEDVIAVLDAVGSDRASIFGVSDGGSLAAALAATHPDRVSSIVLYATVARYRQEGDRLFGLADEDELADFVEWMRRGWGTLEGAKHALPLWAPSMVGDERFAAWLAKHSRQSVSRGAIAPLIWSSMYAYLSDVFPAVRVPTLVLHRSDDRLVPVSQSRYISERVPNAVFAELSGADHFPFVGDAEAVLAETEQFLVGARTASSRHRRLITALCTDIADSPGSLNLTDDAWRQLMAAHLEMVRAHFGHFAGQETGHAGEGLLAAFDGPGRAIRCALAILDSAARRGLSVRAALHAGECDVVESGVTGAAVDTAAGLVESAAPGQILVSGTVRDLVAGSGVRFGERRVVGFGDSAGARTVFPVLSQGVMPEAARRLAIDQANLLRHDGEYWTAAYRGLVVTVRNTKGLQDLARLMAAPQREFHVLDLAAPEAPASTTSSEREALDAGLSIRSRFTEPIIDDTAVAAYKRRVAELEKEMGDADSAGDAEAGEKASEELDAIVSELASAYGLGGRRRRTPDHVERARKAVGRRIRTAIARVDRVHPVLGRHLRASLRTGVYCSYSPEQDTTWAIDRG